MSKRRQQPVSQVRATEVLVTEFNKTLRMGFKYACFSYIGYIAYLSIKELAGETTITLMELGVPQLDIDALKMSMIERFGWLGFVIVLILVIKGQQSLYRRQVKKQSLHTENLERTIDPERTSSGIGRDGQTLEEERI